MQSFRDRIKSKIHTIQGERSGLTIILQEFIKSLMPSSPLVILWLKAVFLSKRFWDRQILNNPQFPSVWGGDCIGDCVGVCSGVCPSAFNSSNHNRYELAVKIKECLYLQKRMQQSKLLKKRVIFRAKEVKAAHALNVKN